MLYNFMPQLEHGVTCENAVLDNCFLQASKCRDRTKQTSHLFFLISCNQASYLSQLFVLSVQ